MGEEKSKRGRKPTTKTRGKTKAATGLWVKAFLGHLSKSGNVTTSAIAAGVNREVVYTRRNNHPEFVEAWDNALEHATDLLVKEARRRAEEGCLEPVFQGGKRVGYITRYSDKLMIELLRAHRPKEFRYQRFEITGAGGVPLSSAVVILPNNEADDSRNQPGGNGDDPEKSKEPERDRSRV